MARVAEVERITGETAIRCRVDLDGTGRAEIDGPLGFLCHMLEALARHAAIDLELRYAGDTEVDHHHTTEDVGLVLGSTVDRALGERKGIERCGSAIFPMDEALARAAVDLGGRVFLAFDAWFSRERLGDLESDTIREFFAGFAQGAAANVHAAVLSGVNDHHKAEALFKAFAKALKQAVRVEPRLAGVLPSTKGAIERGEGS